jgi:hypothetical protein
MRQKRRNGVLTVFCLALFLLVGTAFAGPFSKLGDMVGNLRGIGELLGGVGVAGLAVLVVLFRNALKECIDVFEVVKKMVKDPDRIKPEDIRKLRKEFGEAVVAVVKALERVPAMKKYRDRLRALL